MGAGKESVTIVELCGMCLDRTESSAAQDDSRGLGPVLKDGHKRARLREQNMQCHVPS